MGGLVVTVVVERQDRPVRPSSIGPPPRAGLALDAARLSRNLLILRIGFGNRIEMGEILLVRASAASSVVAAAAF